jgi:hypothetical protein
MQDFTIFAMRCFEYPHPTFGAHAMVARFIIEVDVDDGETLANPDTLGF